MPGSDTPPSSASTIVSLPFWRSPRLKTEYSPVWAVDRAAPDVETPLVARCEGSPGPDGLCCEDLRKEDRTLIDPDIVRDVIIGLSDGLTVPFALTAGLSSLGESRLVVLGGIAELIAGAISMGIGGFLASQAERDHYRYLQNQTASRLRRSCSRGTAREVAEILGPVGVDEKACQAVAQCLSKIEDEAGDNLSSSDGDGESPGPKDVGLTAFLLKFGQGLEEVPTQRLYASAFTIGIGYLVGGLIPLTPYFFIPRAQVALLYSCLVTGLVLLIFGAIKARATGAGVDSRGYIWGAVSTLLVGGVAAGAAFGIVRALESGK